MICTKCGQNYDSTFHICPNELIHQYPPGTIPENAAPVPNPFLQYRIEGLDKLVVVLNRLALLGEKPGNGDRIEAQLERVAGSLERVNSSLERIVSLLDRIS